MVDWDGLWCSSDLYYFGERTFAEHCSCFVGFVSSERQRAGRLSRTFLQGFRLGFDNDWWRGATDC